MTSFLRSCCAGRRRGPRLERAGRSGERRINVPGAAVGILGLGDVADHQANGSAPASESGRLPAGGGNASFTGTISVELSGCVAAPVSFICPLPTPSQAVFCKEGADVTTGICPVTIGGSNCHFPEGMPASSNQLTVGGSVSCGPCANCWVLRSVELGIASRIVKMRSKRVAISPAC